MCRSLSFKALNPGLYVYHCATAPVGMHVANGMYGLILVEPKAGLPLVDKEYYVMQSEFYTVGTVWRGRVATLRHATRRLTETSHVRRVQRQRSARWRATSAVHGKVGEKVRLFVGNGGPNLTSIIPRHRRDF
jgi:nitrite reductase (NO-forming)